MSTNRLKLDWTLKTKTERNQFAHDYLSSLSFTPTETELDTIAKYILWGTSEDGLNGRQEGLDLPTRAHTWDPSSDKIESLDELLESPTFSENIIRKPEDPVFKTPKVQFSRSEARTCAPSHLKDSFEDLWNEIDEVELLVTFYELDHQRRTAPVRDTLLQRFSEAQLEEIHERSTHLNLYNYLKRKHLLVELRRQQYTLKDGYSEPMLLRATFTEPISTQVIWGEDITVEPLGLPFNAPISQKIWRTDRFPAPSDFTEEDLQLLSSFLWSARPNRPVFDFRNIDHLSKLAALISELQEQVQFEDFEFGSTLPQLLQVWDTYAALAPLKEIQREVLNRKLRHETNEQIVKGLNEKFGKHYTLNYISTMYCKVILPTIAATASRHREVCENLFFPENFKTCIDCGRVLLRDNENFVKKARSSDGFSPRCKQCEKKIRDARKQRGNQYGQLKYEIYAGNRQY